MKAILIYNKMKCSTTCTFWTSSKIQVFLGKTFF